MKNYFSMNELECKCCHKIICSTTLKDRLNKLRELWGEPIYVSDAYRCPSHNREVHGSPNSQHVCGTAADIYVGDVNKRDTKEYHKFYGFVLGSQLFDGVGYYPNEEFVHVDVRDDGKSPNKYQWKG